MNRYIEMLLKLNEKTIDPTVDAVQLANVRNEKFMVLGGLNGTNDHLTGLILSIASQSPLRTNHRMFMIGEIVDLYFERTSQMNMHFKKKKTIDPNVIYRLADFAVDWVLEMRGFHARAIPNKVISEQLTERLGLNVSESAYEKKYEYQLGQMVSDLSLMVNDACEVAYKKIG